MKLNDILLNEAKGDLLKLVDKTKDDDLTASDAINIGKQVAAMTGKKQKRYLSMISALGGFYGGKGKGEATLDKLRKSMLAAYEKSKPKESKKKINENFIMLGEEAPLKTIPSINPPSAVLDPPAVGPDNPKLQDISNNEIQYLADELDVLLKSNLKRITAYQNKTVRDFLKKKNIDTDTRDAIRLIASLDYSDTIENNIDTLKETYKGIYKPIS